MYPTGYVTFDIPYTRLNTPASLPGDVRILAPYWSDIDVSDGGRLYVSDYSPGDPMFDSMASLLSGHAKEYGSLENFSVSYLLVATWENVKPYPAANYARDQANATFQTVVGTDGRQTVALSHYLEGGMQWRRDEVMNRSVLIGYSDGMGGAVLDDSVQDPLRPDQSSNVGK